MTLKKSKQSRQPCESRRDKSSRFLKGSKEKLTKYPLILVLWKDAQSSCDWDEKSDIDEWLTKDCLISEVGWLINSTDKHIVICSQISYDNSFGNKTKIPIGWIVRKEKVSICRKEMSRQRGKK